MTFKTGDKGETRFQGKRIDLLWLDDDPDTGRPTPRERIDRGIGAFWDGVAGGDRHKPDFFGGLLLKYYGPKP